MRQVDLCESRTAASLGLWDASAHQAGRDISAQLDAVDKRLAPRAPRVCQLSSARVSCSWLCRPACMCMLPAALPAFLSMNGNVHHLMESCKSLQGLQPMQHSLCPADSSAAACSSQAIYTLAKLHSRPDSKDLQYSVQTQYAVQEACRDA